MRKETAAATRARGNFTIVKYSRNPRIQPTRTELGHGQNTKNVDN